MLIYNKVQEYSNSNENILYKFFGSEIESNYLRFYARWSLPDAEYIWTCSDQRFPTPGLLCKILDLTRNTPDLIIVNTIDTNQTTDKKYKLLDEFFRDCCWHMQVMGANIIHNNLLKYSWSYEECKEQMLFESAHTETRYILPAIANKNKGTYVFTQYFPGAYLVNVKKNLSETIASDIMFLNFIDLVIKSVNSLPPIFDKYKASVIKSMSTKTFWFTIDGFCELQYLGILHTKQCIEYYQKLKLVSFVHPLVIILISLLPKELAGLIRDVIRKRRDWKNRKVN